MKGLKNRFLLFPLPAILAPEKRSFFDLPADQYKDAEMRSRRFSQFRFMWNGKDWQVTKLPHTVFVQAREHNQLVGGIAREFSPLKIDPAKFVKTTANAANLSRKSIWHASVHQIRVKAEKDKQSQVVPEGLHRDGFEFAALLAVARENITGGVTTLVREPGQEPVYEGIIPAMSGLIFDDQAFYHYTSSISAQAGVGYRDMFIIVFKQWHRRQYGDEFERSAVTSEMPYRIQ
jgi:hypothetical protein